MFALFPQEYIFFLGRDVTRIAFVPSAKLNSWEIQRNWTERSIVVFKNSCSDIKSDKIGSSLQSVKLRKSPFSPATHKREKISVENAFFKVHHSFVDAWKEDLHWEQKSTVSCFRPDANIRIQFAFCTCMGSEPIFFPYFSASKSHQVAWLKGSVWNFNQAFLTFIVSSFFY